MTKRVKIGDCLEVVFAHAERGVQTQDPINGRRAFATHKSHTPCPGDRWNAMVVGMNAERTIYIVEPLELLEAGDGLSDLLKQYGPFYHEYIRDAERQLAALLSNEGVSDADEEEAILEGIEDNCLLPRDYVASVFQRYDAARASYATS